MRAAAAILGLAVGWPAAAADVLGVGQMLADPGSTVRVPVRVRDLNASLLNEGDGPDNEIQSFAFQVVFPALHVDGIGFDHAGVTAGRTAFFSQVTPAADNLYVLKAFDEGSNPLAFTLDAPAPGNTIGELVILIDPTTPIGSSIPLQLQSLNAALIDDSATESETVGNGHLVLSHGLVIVGPDAIFANSFE